MTPDDRIDAAELALGLLDGADRAAALERLLADPAFAREVAWWRERFACLTDRYAEVEPPAGLIDRIALDDAAAPATPLRRRWPWAIGGAAAGALAASVALLVVAPVPRPVPPPVVPAPVRAAPLVAVLVPSEGADQAAVAAVIDRDTGSLRLTETIVVPADRVAELWRIGRDQVPRPLGLLPRGSRAPSLLQGAGLPEKDEVLAISIEPRGGSPTGKPTGPVVAAGALVSI